MNKTLILASLLLFTSIATLAQNNPRPSRSRFYNNKYATFKIKTGDILVYHVKNNDEEYDFVVTVKKMGSEINFDFLMPEKGTQANINMQQSAVNSAIKYNNYFTSTNQNFTDQATVWLSKKNFRELLASKRTTMDMGKGKQVFARTSNTTHTINYKGKQKIVTVYNVNSTGAENKSNLHILTEPENPLILFMDLGWTITLKEVR